MNKKMKSAKKTVRDLAIIVELQETRIEELENIIKDILNVKIKDLEEREVKTENKINSLTEKIKKDNADDIDSICNGKSVPHKRSSDFEVHVKNAQESYKCEECGKSFMVKWRLRKHMSIHSWTFIPTCHYYNNKKTCPFEALGCMFVHKLAEWCRYGKICRKKLCSFQHENESERKEKLKSVLDINSRETVDKQSDHVDNNVDNTDDNEILSDSFLEGIMKERESKVENMFAGDEFEGINDEVVNTSTPLKYYPDCENCKDLFNDCVECILREMRETDKQ